MSEDLSMMERALELARQAAHKGEVPVGAVITLEGKIIAEAHNEREMSADPTAHAEILAIARASKIVGHWRLSRTTLYVTLEPCPMCAGAAVNARIERLVFGALDPKAGAVRTLYQIAEDPRLNHRLAVDGGVLAGPCGDVLKDFFQARRS